MSAMLRAQRLLKKRVVVTAAGAGIGRAIAQRLHAEGAQVVGCDVDGAAIDALARDIDIVPFTVDVSSEAAVAAMFADVARRFGGLDGVVNSAGVAGEAGAVTELRVDRWRDLFAVNVEGPMVCIKHAVPLLRAPKPAGLAAGGAIVNISSTGGGLTGYPHRAPYATSKAALNGLTSTPVWKSNLQPDFNVRVCDGFDATRSDVRRELDESNRFVQKLAESTSI